MCLWNVPGCDAGITAAVRTLLLLILQWTEAIRSDARAVRVSESPGRAELEYSSVSRQSLPAC